MCRNLLDNGRDTLRNKPNNTQNRTKRKQEREYHRTKGDQLYEKGTCMKP